MKKNTIITAVIAILLIAALNHAFLSDKMKILRYGYEIKQYVAVFKIPQSGEGLDVILDITYEIGRRPKSGGFKYVGINRVDGLSCLDSSGTKITCDVESFKETRISWAFPSVSDSDKRIVISFHLPEALRLDENETELFMKWPGVFRVPVRNARYEVIAPAAFRIEPVSQKGLKWKSTKINGKNMLVSTQFHLNRHPINIKITKDY